MTVAAASALIVAMSIIGYHKMPGLCDRKHERAFQQEWGCDSREAFQASEQSSKQKLGYDAIQAFKATTISCVAVASAFSMSHTNYPSAATAI